MTRIIRQDIQILRGLAVLGVILFHMSPLFFPKGYLGVDVFFVISGFLLTPVITTIFASSQTFNVRLRGITGFWKDRIYRLAPAAGVNLVLSIVLMLIIGLPADFQRLLKQAFYTLFLLGNVGAYKFSGDYFHPNSNPLLHTWSLAVEEQFYILMPILLMITFIVFHKFNTRIIATYIISMFVFSLLLFLYPSLEIKLFRMLTPNIDQNFLYYSVLSRIWEFLLGGIAAIYGNRISHFISNRKTTNFFLKPFLLLIFTFFIYVFVGTSPKLHIIAITILTTVIMSSRFLDLKSQGAILIWLRNRFIWLGNRSYSLYLYHFPLLYIFQNTQLFAKLNLEKYISNFLYISLLLILSNYSYFYIEEKFRKKIKSTNTTITILVRFSLLPIILVATTTIFVVPLQNYLVIRPELPPYGGRLSIPPLGFMDKNCPLFDPGTGPCYLGKSNSRKTLVLIGDSHAEHYVNSLDKISQENKWRLVVWTQHGCRFVLSPSSYFQYDQSCIEANRRIFHWLEEQKPDAIIVSQMLYPNEDLSKVTDAILSIIRISPNLLVIGNNPIFPDTRDFMQARPKLIGKYQAPKFFATTSMDSRFTTISLKLLTTLQNYGVLTINPITSFCGSGKCVRWKNNNWLYIDDGHLSVYGASVIEGDITKFLELQ